MAADKETCAICLEAYTARTRMKVQCPFCPAAACKGCQQQSMLNSYEDPQCYSCKAGWSPEFLAANFPLSFRNDTLRKHRRKVLLERERTMLPAMQIFVEAKKNIARANDMYTETHAKYQELLTELRVKRVARDKVHIEYTALKSKRDMGETLTLVEKVAKWRLKEKYLAAIKDEETFYKGHVVPAFKAVRTLGAELNRWHHMYNTGEDRGDAEGEKKEKRQFIMRCPAEGCRGFLSQAYQCGVCEKKTCSDCLELLAEGAEHTCKQDLVETAKAIKKETRPCPKCGARIFKLEGCDQMYCTMEGCGTAFSWNSGQIVTGRIHNPHYYEWLRRTGGGQAPREVGDIPCGGVPAAWSFTRAVLRDRERATPNFLNKLTTTEMNHLLDIHRNVTEFESRLRDFPATRPALANKELNVQYLMNQLTEAEWQRQMELGEARFNRKREIGQILQTLVVAASEILQGVQARLEGYRSPADSAAAFAWVRETALPMFEALRTYTNDAYKALAKAQHMAAPQISERWAWLGIRALYKEPKAAKKAVMSEAAGDDAASVVPPLVDDDGNAVLNGMTEAVLNEIV